MDRWGNLNMQQKAQLLGIYASKGYTDLASIINHYNTFQAGGKLTFNEWKSQMQSKYPDIEMDNTKAGYDYNRYFNDNYDDAIRQLSELRHFPDTYKLPNHKTFSNESIYSRSPNIGGSWINDSTFSPSIINRQQYPDIYKEDRPYTEREIYGNQYQKGGSLGTVIPLHKYQSGSSLAYQNEVVDNWMHNWYNNRVPVAMRNMMDYEGAVAEPKDLFKNLRITQGLLNNALYNTRKIPTTYAPLPPNLNGVYRDDRGDILLQYGAADDVLIHEKSHALHDFLGNRWEENGRVMQDAPFWEAIGEVTSDDLYEDENGKYIYDEYLDDVNEIYSRLMQIRYNNNLDPRHHYTIKEIQDLRRKGKLNLPKSDGLERYTDKFIQHLFNEVADGSVNNTLSNIAAKGGKLGKITPLGQWQYPHQVTTIPSNNITMKGVNYPVVGVSNTGDTKYMLPNMDYLFDGNYVTEYPLLKH